jgi:hypothetical protein
VNAESGNGAVSASQISIQLFKAVKTLALEGVVFDVAAASLSDAIFLRMPRPGWQGNKIVVFGKGDIELGNIRVVKAGPHNDRFKVIVADYLRYTAEIFESVFMGP